MRAAIPSMGVRGRGRLGDWLRRGLGDGLGGAEAADADNGVNAAFVQRDVQVETEIAAKTGTDRAWSHQGRRRIRAAHGEQSITPFDGGRLKRD